jgi:hypothetical protein
MDLPGGPAPTIGRIVWFRSRTGAYDVPAMITATADTLNPDGVQAYRNSIQLRHEAENADCPPDRQPPLRGVPPLSSDRHVHLTVFTPGIPGQRATAEDFLVSPSTGIVGENVAGCYQEFDVPQDATRDAHVPPGTWRWPPRV